MKSFLLWGILFFPFFSGAYVSYPVAADDKRVYYSTVDAQGSISLSVLSIDSGESEAAVSAYCNPYMVRLLPGGGGISFIDDGLLKLRHTNRRSEKTIDSDLPLYDYNQVIWLTDECALVSARLGYYYGIFKVSINGSIEPLMHDNQANYVFPYVVNNVLYYVEKTDKNSRLMYYNMDSKEVDILMNSDDLLMYPYVNSLGECYVLECCKAEDYLFKCYKVKPGFALLFEFSMSGELIDEGQVQDMAVLCPLYYSDYIYYIDTDNDSGNLSIYRYEIETQKSICCISKIYAGKDCLGLLDVNGVIWYGGNHFFFT